MFCPNCARENLEMKNYCPSCGLRLEAIVQALTNELTLTNQKDDKSLTSSGLKRPGWRYFLPGGFFVMFLGVIIAILGKQSLVNEPALTDIGTIITVLGMGLISYFVVMGMMRQGIKNIPRTKTTPHDKQTVKLPPPSQVVELGSITESTTREFDTSLRGYKKLTPSKDLLVP